MLVAASGIRPQLKNADVSDMRLSYPRPDLEAESSVAPKQRGTCQEMREPIFEFSLLMFGFSKVLCN